MKMQGIGFASVSGRCSHRNILVGITLLPRIRLGFVGGILASALLLLAVSMAGCCNPAGGDLRTEIGNVRSRQADAQSQATTPPGGEQDVSFTVQAPKLVPIQRKVRETFPLRNYVFFDEGSPDIPKRYVALTNAQATGFTEGQLQQVVPANMTGRSKRQLTVYHNILNILGDRMRANPGTTVSLSGATGNGPEDGRVLAESIKSYLRNAFGIDGNRITTEGRDKPRIPSEQPGGTRELTLLRAEDRRVDIESKSPELLMQVGGPADVLKPVYIYTVQDDPLDGHVLFHVSGAKEVLSSWSLEITDERGDVQHFGPFTREREGIPGQSILGARPEGNFKVVMLGTSKSGHQVRKDGTVYLARRNEPIPEGLRFSILFEFDKSKTVATYETFLAEMVVPLIPEDGTVYIHGHTDIIGDVDYNHTLSHDRAQDAHRVIGGKLSDAAMRGITFDTFGFGEDVGYAPFDNDLPEERFYNRTVIIDFVPGS